jgi:hypothetical protein
MYLQRNHCGNVVAIILKLEMQKIAVIPVMQQDLDAVQKIWTEATVLNVAICLVIDIVAIVSLHKLVVIFYNIQLYSINLTGFNFGYKHARREYSE